MCFLDAPRNVKVLGMHPDNSIDINDILSCEADGFPSPDYEWIDEVTGKLTNGSNITVTVLGPRSYTCTAKNRILGLVRTSQFRTSVIVTGTRVTDCIT